MANVIRDEMDRPVRSMADGKLYTSKAALRRTYRASGNPRASRTPRSATTRPGSSNPKTPKPDFKSINDSMEKALARYRRGERPRDA